VAGSLDQRMPPPNAVPNGTIVREERIGERVKVAGTGRRPSPPSICLPLLALVTGPLLIMLGILVSRPKLLGFHFKRGR
jgi:hypothetical protein